MKETAKKIKSLRNRKHFSQEELAERSGLALRTVQRIENGETEPRGDTLMRLAAALGVTVDDLADWGGVDDDRYVAMMNLSALSCMISAPLLNILLPLVLWLARKDRVRGLNAAAGRLLNFQITWSIVVSLWVVCFLCIKLLPIVTVAVPERGWHEGFECGMLIFLAAIYIANVALIAVNTVRLRRGGTANYGIAIPFIR